jgi:hypothetical protein
MRSALRRRILGRTASLSGNSANSLSQRSVPSSCHVVQQQWLGVAEANTAPTGQAGADATHARVEDRRDSQPAARFPQRVEAMVVGGKRLDTGMELHAAQAQLLHASPRLVERGLTTVWVHTAEADEHVRVAAHRGRNIVVGVAHPGTGLLVHVKDDRHDAQPTVVLGDLVGRHVQARRPKVRLGGRRVCRSALGSAT